ncbi:MAG: zinc-ribbon domain-containing protein [Bacillota bacterium]
MPMCQHCGATIAPNQKFCSECGKKAQPDTPNETIRYCPNCGEGVKENQSVCLNCGTDLHGSRATQVPGRKSKLAAGLLGILLGGFGIHNFYLGFTGKAIAQLLLTIIGWIIIIGPIIAGIWGLIEGILILTGSMNTDAEGNLLGE